MSEPAPDASPESALEISTTPPSDAERPGPAVEPHEIEPTRREALKKAAAVCLGTTAIAVPVTAGACFALDPLFRKEGNAGAGQFRRVAALEAVVPGAPPRTFPVVADLEDAWARTENVQIGSVLLFREADDSDQTPRVLAWSTICSHAGCAIGWKPETDQFECPCHSAQWAADGTRSNNIPPRDMDGLVTEIRDDEVWVRYQKFKTGVAEQIPV